jgi:chromosome segregation ATPase
MPFTVEDFQDLLRLLRERPEWRDQLRQVLLVDGLVDAIRGLSEEVRRLAEAQLKAEGRIGRLEEAITRLTEAQLKTEERLGRLEERTDRLEEAITRLTEAQLKTEETVRILVRDVGDLKGESLERAYRDRAPAYFGRILQRIRAWTLSGLGYCWTRPWRPAGSPRTSASTPWRPTW